MNAHQNQTTLTRWVRRDFERITRRNRGHNIRIGEGRKIHAGISSKLHGVEVIRTKCGSSPAIGPTAMQAVDKPVTCSKCDPGVEQHPYLF